MSVAGSTAIPEYAGVRPGDTARRSGHFVPRTCAVVGAAALPRPAQAPAAVGEPLPVLEADDGLGVPELSLPPDGPQPASARATTITAIRRRLLRRLAAMPSSFNLPACTNVIPS
jgi:hypothetical protein